jgi:hypothetical protein
MSRSFSLYALDLPRFEKLLGTPVADVLRACPALAFLEEGPSLRERLEASGMDGLAKVVEAVAVPLVRGSRWKPADLLLQSAFRVLGVVDPRALRLSDLFQKVARDIAKGARRYALEDFDFPVKPPEDGDAMLSVWTPEESRFLVETLPLLPAEGEVRDLVDGLLRLRDVRFERHVVGFATL